MTELPGGRVARREEVPTSLPGLRATLLVPLLFVIGLAWVYLAAMVAEGMHPVTAAAWTASYAASVFVMWVLMMVAMMLPSALPMILIFDRFSRSTASTLSASSLGTGLFAAGYVMVWVGFSIAATLAQWALGESGLPSGGTSTATAASLFIAAGAYQFAPLKRACLDACRSPIAFLSAYWRPGAAGAMRMGLHHGLFCLGCCWLMMGLLFVGGVMSLLWIVPIALFVLIEKCLPGGERMGKLGGALLIAWGVAAFSIA